MNRTRQTVAICGRARLLPSLPPFAVAQTSKSAVSRVSKPAGLDFETRRADNFQVFVTADGKQVWKPALQKEGSAGASPYRAWRFVERSTVENAAFTLVEVMIAITIFFICMFAILGVLSSGIHAASILRSSGPTAGMVASYFAVSNKIEEGQFQDDFSDIAGYQGYRWEAEAILITNDLYRMNFVVIDPNGNQSSFLNDVKFYKPGSSQGSKMGLQPQPGSR